MVIGEIISGMLALDPLILVVVLFGIIVISFKVLSYLIRVFVTGAVFALFPIVANFAGLGVPLTFESVLWSAIFGIVAYMLFTSVKFGLSITKKIFSPFGRMFKSKPKQQVIIKERDEKEEKK
ncbi:MAG: hypothetical protein ABIJ92_01750 [Candidatus Aenigmatarchaeota archaeon]